VSGSVRDRALVLLVLTFLNQRTYKHFLGLSHGRLSSARGPSSFLFTFQKTPILRVKSEKKYRVLAGFGGVLANFRPNSPFNATTDRSGRGAQNKRLVVVTAPPYGIRLCWPSIALWWLLGHERTYPRSDRDRRNLGAFPRHQRQRSELFQTRVDGNGLEQRSQQ
jgi:hypothetical protein